MSESSSAELIDELALLEHEAGMLLAHLQDLEIFHHDVLAPELAKLTEDVRLLNLQSSVTNGAESAERDAVDGSLGLPPAAPSSAELELATELRRVKSSFSWRLTAPLRFARQLFSRLRR